MPARRFAGNQVSVAIYDVLGFDSAREAEFVGHVALASQTWTFSATPQAGIRVTHMVPPLHINGPALSESQSHGEAGLDEVKSRQIDTFVREMDSEFRAEEQRRRATGNWNRESRDRFRVDQYTICPHVRWPDAARPYHQFSCAGFVHEAYAEAEIDLVFAAESELPPCPIESLRIAYADLSELLQDVAFRATKGLDGSGPWPILLPGHLLNALDRPREEILSAPFKAESGDEYFPSRRKAVDTKDSQQLTSQPASFVRRKLSECWELVRRFFAGNL